jgi:hypothetical protein
VLRTKPDLRAYLTRCRHCRVFFLNAPQNIGRHDIGCPFGCKEATRKSSSTQRSTEYNSSAEGKVKKKDLNGKRKAKNPDSGDGSGETPEGSAIDADTVAYVRSVTSLIEGRRVSRKEIEEMLERVMRQHSLSFGKRKDYIQKSLKNNPP